MTFYVAVWNERNANLRSWLGRTADRMGAEGVVDIRDMDELQLFQETIGAAYWVAMELVPMAEPLSTLNHHERSVYLIGPDFGTIPQPALELMDTVRYIETPGKRRILPTPVVAGIVLHHRLTQLTGVNA